MLQSVTFVGQKQIIMTTSKKSKTVKVLGYEVKEGSKKHLALLQQVKIFNQIAKSENGF
jgi:hypothetical protein